MKRQSVRLILVDKEIDINNSPVMFSRTITGDNLNALFEVHNSRWTIEDGWLTGINPEV